MSKNFQSSSKEARPEPLVPFGEYYRRHILKDLPPRPCFSSVETFWCWVGSFGSWQGWGPGLEVG